MSTIGSESPVTDASAAGGASAVPVGVDEGASSNANAGETSAGLPELGAIEFVALREVFSHEARVFTPWLAENLQLLAASLNLGQLAVLATEFRVGDFASDILAETIEGDVVVIENQLERSDHTHLGQIITYAAGVGAAVVIWVLPELREEHRAALDWLNENTIEDLRFFGVEVAAVRIGESDIAPLFSVEVRPNRWQKHARGYVGARGGAAGSGSGNTAGWEWLYQALASVPPGRWTSWSDLAAYGNTTAAWVGRHLYGKWTLAGLHRMLSPEGRPWEHFQWPDADDTRQVLDVLRDEGAVAVGGSQAIASRRVSSDELAKLVSEREESDDSEDAISKLVSEDLGDR